MTTDDQNNHPRRKNELSEDRHRFEALSTAVDGTTSRRRALQLLAGSAVGSVLVYQSIGNGAAQETQSAADERPADGLEKLVQFVHPKKVYGFLPGLDEERLAGLYGLDVTTYRRLRGQFAANARDAAQNLLADPSFVRCVRRLPFGLEATVVGIGESVTDDLQSWLEILRHVLDMHRPTDNIHVVNHGVEGSTTTEGLGRFVQILDQQPDWIVCCLGAADAVQHGREPTKTAVSLEETAKNLAEMRHLAATHSDAHWVWITPPTVNERLASEFPPFQQNQMTIRNEDLIAIGDVLRKQSEAGVAVTPVRESDPVVDIQAVFGQPAPPEFVLSDGIHPSLVGHRAIATALVERLAARPGDAPNDRELG